MRSDTSEQSCRSPSTERAFSRKKDPSHWTIGGMALREPRLAQYIVMAFDLPATGAVHLVGAHVEPPRDMQIELAIAFRLLTRTLPYLERVWPDLLRKTANAVIFTQLRFLRVRRNDCSYPSRGSTAMRRLMSPPVTGRFAEYFIRSIDLSFQHRMQPV